MRRTDHSSRGVLPMWCVVVCDLEKLWMRRAWPTGGCSAKKRTNKLFTFFASNIILVFQIRNIRYTPQWLPSLYEQNFEQYYWTQCNAPYFVRYLPFRSSCRNNLKLLSVIPTWFTSLHGWLTAYRYTCRTARISTGIRTRKSQNVK